MTRSEFDVIVVGSGTCGATLGRELARRNKKVLILEQGTARPLQDTIAGILAVGREFRVGRKLKAMTAVTAGGSSSVYFGVCKLPTAETFAQLGIDLAAELAETRRELPVAELPDEFLQPQSLLIRDSARALGYSMKKNPMLIDQSRCKQGNYSYAAKWKARSYLEEAVSRGARLMTSAVAQRVIVEKGRAIGVEYKHKTGLFDFQVRRVYADRIVLAAGALTTPKLLIDCGVKNVGDRGFFCKPAFAVFGTVPGLEGRDAFLGQLDCDLGNGVSIGDGAMNESLFKLFMLANFKWKQLFAHATTLSVGILMNDSMSGEITAEGEYRKALTPEEHEKLRAAEQTARQILERAGARHIFSTRLVAGIPGGVLRIPDHLDENLQTRIRELYVCDHSLICDQKITPTITLICLAKHLARHLAPAHRASRAVEEPAALHV